MREQYLAIDFLHDDFDTASACAAMLGGGGLEYAIASRSDMDATLEDIYRLEHRTLGAEPGRTITLVAKALYAEKPIDPEKLRLEFNRIGRETQQTHNWQTGSSIRIAKLAQYGTNIFDKLKEEKKEKAVIPVWRDDGHDVKLSGERKPRTALNDNFFSINTSKLAPHWVGHIDDWAVANIVAYNPSLESKPENISLLTLTRL